MAQLERTAVAAAVQGEFPCLICFGGWPDGQYLAAQLLAADEERAVLPSHIIGLPRRQRSALASLRPGRPLAANQTDRHAPLLHRQPDAQIRLLLHGLDLCHSRLSRNRRLPRHNRSRRSEHHRANHQRRQNPSHLAHSLHVIGISLFLILHTLIPL